MMHGQPNIKNWYQLVTCCACMRACVCVCVCVRERESARPSVRACNTHLQLEGSIFCWNYFIHVVWKMFT
jgi:hypothetical protein